VVTAVKKDGMNSDRRQFFKNHRLEQNFGYIYWRYKRGILICFNL